MFFMITWSVFMSNINQIQSAHQRPNDDFLNQEPLMMNCSYNIGFTQEYSSTADVLYNLQCLEMDSNAISSYVQLSIIHKLIENWKCQQDSTRINNEFGKLQPEFLKSLEPLSSPEKIQYLTEMLTALRMDLYFLSSENCLIIAKSWDCLSEATKNFKSKNNQKISLILPYHGISFIQSLENSTDSMENHCFDALTSLLKFASVLDIHIHSDMTTNGSTYINFLLNNYNKIGVSENVVAIELDFSGFKQNISLFNYPSSLKINYQRYLNSGQEFKYALIDLRYFKFLKTLKLNSVTDGVIDGKLSLQREVCKNLKNLIFSNMLITLYTVDSFKHMSSLVNLVFNEGCRIDSEVNREIHKLQNAKNIIFEDVECTDFAIGNEVVKKVIVSMTNRKLEKINIEENMFRMKFCKVMDTLGLNPQFRELKLSEITHTSELLPSCLNIRGLRKLNIQDLIISKVSDVLFPDKCACSHVLTSIKIKFKRYCAKVKFDMRNIEQFTQLKEFRLVNNSSTNAEIIGFDENSSVLKNLSRLYLDQLNIEVIDNIKNLKDYDLKLDTLELGLASKIYDRCHQLLSNSSIQENVKHLEIYDYRRDNEFNINISKFRQLRYLVLSLQINKHKEFFESLIQEGIHVGLEKLTLHRGIIFDPIFFNVISEIKELKIVMQAKFKDLYGTIQKIDENFIFKNNVHSLTVNYLFSKEELVDDLTYIALMYPKLKCLVLDMDVCCKRRIFEFFTQKQLKQDFFII